MIKMNSNISPMQSPETGDLQPAAFNYTQWRERFIVIILRIACVLGIVLIAVSFPTLKLVESIIFIGLYLVLLLVTILPVRYTIRAYTLLFITFAVGLDGILLWGPYQDGNIFLLTGILLASLLFDRRVDVLAWGIGVLATTTIAILEQTGAYHLAGANVPATALDDWVGYIANFTILGALAAIAVGQFKVVLVGQTASLEKVINALSIEKTDLEQKVRERTDELETRTIQFRTSSNVARALADIKDVTELLGTATQLASEKFGYYHVGLFILDEQKKTAFLQASSSAIGKQLVGQGFRVEPDKRSPIAFVVENNRPAIASDIDNINFVRDENFPITRSRMILPLAVRGKVLGLLDIHSDQTQAFDRQDAEILQTLADLIAISFDNVRLIGEMNSLINQAEINTSFQTQQTWSKLTSRQKPAYQYTPAGVRPVFSADNRDGGDGLRIPLILHGQNIGAIKLRRKGDMTTWSARERVLVEKIADQVALALENSRLVDEAQKGAMRDQMIANISTRVRETLDIESVIRTAATELRKVFDLKEAEITVGSPLAENPSPKNQ
jgi:GAF domain-containing protein